MERQEFDTIFNRLDNGKRLGNAACDRGTYGRQPEADTWTAYDANLYGAYAAARVFDKLNHDDALALAQTQIQPQAPNTIKVAAIYS